MSQLFARKTVDQCVADSEIGGGLRRSLGPLQLTALGIGAIIGAGIFAAIGTAISGDAGHLGAGSAIVISIILAGVTSAFAAITYSEFAAMIPISGSAYTYAYATLGELFAWIIGWDLVLEYAVGSATVANGWSSYFQSVLGTLGYAVPKALNGPVIVYDPKIGHLVATGSVINLPALVVVAAVTVVLVVGIRESASFNATMVMIKVAAVLFVIGVGAFYGDTTNWHPFAPYGYAGLSLFGKTLAGRVDAGGQPLGMLAGAALAFFAYIGFDAVSTH